MEDVRTIPIGCNPVQIILPGQEYISLKIYAIHHSTCAFVG
jgi:hypothetical protein